MRGVVDRILVLLIMFVKAIRNYQKKKKKKKIPFITPFVFFPFVYGSHNPVNLLVL